MASALSIRSRFNRLQSKTVPAATSLSPAFVLARAASQGNIALALVLVFSLIIGSMALLYRSKASFAGAFFSSESRESREAAEYGMKYILSELAKTPNRKLIVSGLSPSSWSTVSSATIQNPCSVNTAGAYVTPTSTAKALGDSSVRTLPSDSTKKFWLKSISYKSAVTSGSRDSIVYSRTARDQPYTSSSTGTYSASNINLSGVNRGYIELVVVGESQETGKPASVSVIKREFEVIPKCCQRSFGYTYQNPSSPVASHGQDLRSCPAFGLGSMALVTGAAGNGIFSNNGKSFDLWEGAIGTPQDQAITLNPADAKNLTNGQTTSLVGSTQELPPQASEPSGIQNSACIQTSVTIPDDGLNAGGAGACSTSTTSASQTVYQLAGNASGGSTKSCPSPQIIGGSVPSGAILVDDTKTNLSSQTPNGSKCYLVTTRSVTTTNPYCIEANNPTTGDNEYYCKIRFVSTNGTVTVKTSDKPVNLLFYDATNTALSGGQTATGGSVDFTGGTGSGFVHLTGSPAATAGLADASRFKVYNNISGSSFELSGATGALAGFFDLRYSNVSLNGGGSNGNINLSGILWTNNLSLSGDLTFVNPASGDCSVTPFAAGSTCDIMSKIYPTLFDTNPSNDPIRPGYDWIPRSIFSLSMF